MSQTHPIFRITLNGGEIADILKDRILSITVVDNAGSETDSFNIRIDDKEIQGEQGNYTGQRVPMPKAGSTVQIELGYEDEGLVYMGEFRLDEIRLTADPAWEMHIHGESANMMSPLKTLRSDAWDNTTIGDIVSTIAGRNGLNPIVSGELAGIFIEHRDQHNRSDHAFLTRLAVDFKAVFKIAEGQCIFALSGEDVSVTGQDITDIEIDLFNPFQGVLGWDVLHQYRGRFSTVTSWHHDFETGETVPTQVESMPEDGGGSDRTLARRSLNPDESQVAAESEARRLKQTSAKATVTLVGEPRFSAEGKMTLVNFRDGVDGEWKIKTVTHEYTPNGLTSVIDADVPNNATSTGG